MALEIKAMLMEMQKSAGGPAVVSSRAPFKALISTVLSQRTRDENTEKASKRLFAKYSTPEQIAAAPLGELRRLIRPSGFYKVKSGRIKAISRLIVERFGGKVPGEMRQLLSLPGVGRKTANCVLVYGFGKPAIPVDVHVHRISNRLGIVKTKTPEQTEEALGKTIERRYWLSLNHLMVRFGQGVCLPRKPRCSECGLRESCGYFSKIAREKQI